MKRKYELNFYSFYDTDGMENHLESMAEKGWFLYKIINCIWCYRKESPRKVRYNVSYYAKASMFEAEKSDGQKTFQDFCDYSGWKLAADDAKFQVFISDKENATPIYTDPESEIKAIAAVSKFNIWSSVCLIMLGIMQIFLFIDRFKNNPMDVLSSNLMLGAFLGISLIILYFSLEIAGYFLWRRKAIAASETGEFIVTSKNGRKYNRCILFLAIFAVCLGVITSGEPSQQWLYLVNILGVVLLIVIVNCVRIILKKKKVDTEQNRIITIIVDVVLAAALAGFITFGGIKLFNQENDNNEMKLVAEDLLGVKKENIETDVQISSSFLLSQNQGWQYKEKGESLYYKIIDVKLPILNDFCLESMLHEKDHMGSYSDNYDPEHPFYVYKEIDSSSWQANRAWQLTAYGNIDNEYLLQYGSRLINVSFNWELTDEQKLKATEILNK